MFDTVKKSITAAALSLLLVAPVASPLVAAGDHEIHIPEPMVFDMVRGLGARQGELEANVLVAFPLDDADERDIGWAPEVEYAVRDGVALEVELPFEGDELEAYKFAAQLTFGTAFDDHFIHGSQFIVEKTAGEDLAELTLLYIPGVRFDERWSALTMLGVRTEMGGDSGDETEALVNFTLFLDVSPRLTFGVENDYASGLGDESDLLVMPQVHYEITNHFEIQGGIGAHFHDGESDGTAAVRFIYSH